MDFYFHSRKLVYYVTFLLTVHVNTHAQCDIPNGNFDETYYWPELLLDTSTGVEINPDSLDLENTPEIVIDFRPDFLTTFGWWFSIFLLFAPALALSELETEFEENPTPELQASIDSLNVVFDDFDDFWLGYPFFLFTEQRGNGNVAGIKLWSISAADYFITPFECTEEPAFLRGEFKNEGSDTDSLLVSVVFGKRSFTNAGFFVQSLQAAQDSSYLQEFEEFLEFGIAGESYLTNQTNDYSNFEIPLNYDAIEADWDSVSIRFLASTDTNYVNVLSNNTATFWLDNFQFSDISFDEEKLGRIEELDANEIIDLLASSEGISDILLYTVTGQELLRKRGSSPALIEELRNLPGGIYLFRLHLENKEWHSVIFGKL